MLDDKVNVFLSKFRDRTHAILFYYSQEIKRELLFSHLKFGADGNQGLAYVCSEEDPLHIHEEMKDFGLDVEKLRDRNRLTVNKYDRIYIVDGVVDIERIMSAFSNLTTKYSSMGFDGMRAAAEMSCFFSENRVEELVAYENALHRQLQFHAEGICAYNVFDLVKTRSLETVMSLVRAHDPVIFAGPEKTLLLGPDQVEKTDVENALEIRP